MIVGFKGDSERLKNLYNDLGLKEVMVNSFEDIKNAIASNDGNTVLTNYNEVVVFAKPTADLVEKRNIVLNAISSCKKNVYLSLTAPDPSLDKLPLDFHICTKIDTNDISKIEDIFNFMNTDLPYNGKLDENCYAVRAHNEVRAESKNLTELKSLIR